MKNSIVKLSIIVYRKNGDRKSYHYFNVKKMIAILGTISKMADKITEDDEVGEKIKVE